MRILAFLGRAMVFSALTIATQIGGIAYLTGLGISFWRGHGRWQKLVCVFLAYTAFSIGAYFAAPLFGRVPLPCLAGGNDRIKLQSAAYCVLNRHYVSPDLKAVGDQLAADMAQKFPDAQTLALDANFPFFTGFPLLPHLSHNDGLKLDIAFYYQTPIGAPAPGRTKSPIGYWAFEDGPSGCQDNALSMRWDVVWFRPFLNDLKLDRQRTAAALRWLSREGARLGVSRVFIEPHLAQSLGVSAPAIRFQGCRAARHDDHIHVEIVRH